MLQWKEINKNICNIWDSTWFFFEKEKNINKIIICMLIWGRKYLKCLQEYELAE